MRLSEVPLFFPVRLPTWDDQDFVIRFPQGWAASSSEIIKRWKPESMNRVTDRDDFIPFEIAEQPARGKSCVDCKHWHKGAFVGYRGECHRYPPIQETFPLVCVDSYCGEFSAKEEPLLSGFPTTADVMRAFNLLSKALRDAEKGKQ